MVHALETINQLKNCFSAQDVRFGSIATVSLIDYGRAELSTNDTLHVPHSFFKWFFLWYFRFSCRIEKDH